MDNIKEIIGRIKQSKNVSTNTKLAEKLGVSYNTLNTWIKREKIPEKIIQDIVQSEQLSYDWLLNGVKSETKTDDSVSLSVSLLQAGAGEGVYNFETQETLLSLNPKIFSRLTNQTLTAVEVMGDSMEPELYSGDYVIITPPSTDRATEDGIYAIRIDGMIKVKSLQFLLDGTIKIISYNKNYQTEIYDPSQMQIDFSIVGKLRIHLTFK